MSTENSQIFQTERLILRPWREDDAEDLFRYAQDPQVGPMAGWPVHTSVENSRDIIRNVLSAHETYAVTLKADGKAIGSIGLLFGERSNMQLSDNECEIGFWIGVPFWGQGLIPEAVRRLQQHCFEDLGITKIWGIYFDGNTKSMRAQEKCGFRYQYTKENMAVPLLGEQRTEHFTCITKDEWLALNR